MKLIFESRGTKVQGLEFVLSLKSVLKKSSTSCVCMYRFLSVGLLPYLAFMYVGMYVSMICYLCLFVCLFPCLFCLYSFCRMVSFLRDCLRRFLFYYNIIHIDIFT